MTFICKFQLDANTENCQVNSEKMQIVMQKFEQVVLDCLGLHSLPPSVISARGPPFSFFCHTWPWICGPSSTIHVSRDRMTAGRETAFWPPILTAVAGYACWEGRLGNSKQYWLATPGRKFCITTQEEKMETEEPTAISWCSLRPRALHPESISLHS